MLLNVFHKLVIPFLGGFVVTVLKLVADDKEFTWNEANDIALDLVLIAVGTVGYFFVSSNDASAASVIESARDKAVDGGIVDAVIGALLIYFRWHRRKKSGPRGPLPPVGVPMGVFQLFLGIAAIVWTVFAF